MNKRLVICADGTWNTPDRMVRGKVTASNVAKMARAIAPKDAQGKEQVAFYDKGVGTARFDRLLGGAFGVGLSKNVKDAYLFLVARYEPGDELFFFGFSRGAYTVRSTVGLIRKCGLLRREHIDKLPDAYELYRTRGDHPRDIESELFRRTYSWETRIKFIGVWDTVGALGIPLSGLRLVHKLNMRWQFHDLELSSYVDHAYQALAIDERRKPFMPAIWEQQSQSLDIGQKMEQVWFAGVHSNIGGGYPDTGLSDITFQWMQQKAEVCDLAFNKAYIDQVIKPDPLGELRDSKVGFYKLLPSFLIDYLRPIGIGKNANEYVHPTALERVEKVRSYKPENLIACLNGRREGSASTPHTPSRAQEGV